MATGWQQRWKDRARLLKSQVIALMIAYRDPRTPWSARIVAACVLGYAFSPIDLIPDFIPVLGIVDDLILVPLGVALAIRLIPAEVWAEAQVTAASRPRGAKPVNRLAAVLIVALWIALAAVAWRLLRGAWW
ncbi:MAG: YkvA family protein [Thermomicrobiales bacterium]